jgi:hypothetical protein
VSEFNSAFELHAAERRFCRVGDDRATGPLLLSNGESAGERRPTSRVKTSHQRPDFRPVSDRK